MKKLNENKQILQQSMKVCLFYPNPPQTRDIFKRVKKKMDTLG